MTADGRYTVCRMNKGPIVEYRAFLRGDPNGKTHVPAQELAHVEVKRPKPELERDDPAMKGAIRAMQKACLEHAGRA